MAQQPLTFEPNLGQSDPAVKFLSRGQGYSLFLTGSEAVLSMTSAAPSSAFSKFGRTASDGLRVKGHPRSPTPIGGERAVVRIALKGAAHAPRIIGVDKMAGRSNYFIGNDPKKWRTDVPNYAKVELKNVYPGIDLIYHGSQQGRLEYDFRLAPGANPNAIRLSFRGAAKLSLNARGDLIVSVGRSKLLEHAPAIYQEGVVGRRTISGGWRLHGAHEASFQTAAYDRTRPIVIDPVLNYSTYLGGSSADVAYAIALDSNGNNYITGLTCSTNFPTMSPAQPNAGGNCDAFVTEISSTGTALLYSTYLGGSSIDEGISIAVDGIGAAYVTGETLSSDFPTTIGPGFGGVGNAFVTKLGANGSLAFSRYLGGSSLDLGLGIALAQGCSANCNPYVVGRTNSSDFPTTTGVYQQTSAATQSGFVTQLSSDGSTLIYSTFLGGPPNPPFDFYGQATRGIAVDGAGDAYVTGGTLDTGFPVTSGAAQTTFGGAVDCYVTKLNPTATAPLLYSTFLGGSGTEDCWSIALLPGCSSNCNAYVNGSTSSNDLPTTTGAAQSSIGGIENGLEAELSADGSQFLYLTYLGGRYNGSFNIAVDSSGDAYATGFTSTDDFPTLDPTQIAPAPNGILFSSTNGFSTIAQSGLPSSAGSVYSMTSDNAGAIYAGTTRNGLFKSVNQGSSFGSTGITSGFVSALAFDPSTNALYAGRDIGLVKSTNGGATFTPDSILPTLGNTRVLSIAAIPCVSCASGHSTVLAGTVNGVFASSDGGVTFGATPAIPSTFVYSLISDPNNTANSTSIVYAGTNKGLFQSTDGGMTFNSFFLPWGDVIALAADGTTNPTTFYMAFSTFTIGIIASDFSTFFRPFQPDQDFFSLAIDTSTTIPTAYAASTSGYIYTSTDRGITWVSTNLAGQPAALTLVSVLPPDYFASEFLEDHATVTELNPTGTALDFSTYLQGASQDVAYGIAVDPAGTRIHVAGITASANFPIAPNPGAYQPNLAGDDDAFLSVFGPPAPNAITVNNTTDPASTSGNGFCTLREAINNANAASDTSGGDCAAGTGNDIIFFSVSGTITLVQGTLQPVANTLTIDGTGRTVTVGGASSFQVLVVQSGATLNLNNLTIENGNSSNGSGQGGGIDNEGTLTVTNSTFSGNQAANGGGIENGGMLTVTNSTFSANQAADGSGIENNGTATVTNSTFFGNTATGGGGGISNGGLLTIT
ncbi:SBBP repeat-containing protein, partial [Candidatus Binatus sp.]|uniref:DUF7948 domain-containing protein n=1 Tax=Candidatus Binatus sp. TaxID=2811406 RepID=UPI003C5EF174